MAQALRRLGPNPYVREILAHAPRIAGWAAVGTVFFGWPFIGRALNKAGIFNP